MTSSQNRFKYFKNLEISNLIRSKGVEINLTKVAKTMLDIFSTAAPGSKM